MDSRPLSVSSSFVALARKVGNIRCIYDCGSRDGRDGLELMRQLEAAELHLFECNPPAIELCRQNAAKSAYADRTTIAPFAIAEKSGTLTFHSIDAEKTVTPHADGNIGASSLYRANPDYPKEQYVQKSIEVKATSLDDYCQTHARPDLLWMDLQGAEARAIDGAASILKDVKLIYVEVSFRSMYLEQALFRDIHSRLKDRFDLVDLESGRWPKLPQLYSLLRFGPWVANAVYLSKALAR